MALDFFKPNKSIKGALASFTFNSKDGALFLQLVKQTSYNEAKHIGGFKDGDKLFLKFNAGEIGGFLRALRELKEVKFFHSSTQHKTSITFAPYKAKGSEDFAGFGLSVLQGDQNFRIPFSFEEGYLLEEYLKYVLKHFFDASYSADIQRAKEYAEKKRGQTDKPEAPKEETGNDPAPEEDEADSF